MSKILDFSEMLLTKLCHDLAGALGAVDNGIEFMEMNDNPELNDKATELVKSNSQEAVNKLKFYRLLYGITHSQGEVDFNDIKDIAENYFKITNHKVEWNNDKNSILLTSKGFKLLINLMYINSIVLLGGGEIDISYLASEKGKEIIITGKGKKLHEGKDISQILSEHELRDVKLNNVQIHYTAKIAAELEAIIKTEISEDQFVISCNFS